MTGNYHPDTPREGDTRGNYERFSATNFEANMKLLEPAREIASAHKISLPRLAVAWVLAQGAPLIPFPGCKSRRHLDDILGALDVSLSPAELQQLDAAFPAGAAAGHRYTPAQLAAWHQ
jgi:aryl-alcohol dehydrogenase-like predicted oxidoreductase